MEKAQQKVGVSYSSAGSGQGWQEAGTPERGRKIRLQASGGLPHLPLSWPSSQLNPKSKFI